MQNVDRRRSGVLTTSYAALVLLAYLAYATAYVHVGALAVIPILFIAYYVRPFGALITAFFTGVILGFLDQNVAVSGRVIDFPPIMDALILSVALCTIVLVVHRLKEMAAANEVLHGRLVKARREADSDPLTGIANRSYFLHRLEEAMSRQPQDGHIAVLFCDLDGFKKVNDLSGHLAGDQVLRLAVGRLLNAVRTVDTVARIGGDEFAILVERVHDTAEALRMARKIESAFTDPFHLYSERHTVGITVGVSFYPDDATDASELLNIADRRMYHAKNAKNAAGVTSRSKTAS